MGRLQKRRRRKRVERPFCWYVMFNILFSQFNFKHFKGIAKENF